MKSHIDYFERRVTAGHVAGVVDFDRGGAAVIFRTHYRASVSADFLTDIPQIIPWTSGASIAPAQNPMVFQTTSPYGKALAAGVATEVASDPCARVVIAHTASSPEWVSFQQYLRRGTKPRCADSELSILPGDSAAVSAKKLSNDVALAMGKDACVMLYGDAVTTGGLVRESKALGAPIKWFAASPVQRTSEFVSEATLGAAEGLTLSTYVRAAAPANVLRTWFAKVPSDPVAGFDITSTGADSFFHGADSLFLLVLALEVAGPTRNGERLRDALAATGRRDGSTPLTIDAIEHAGLRATLEEIAAQAAASTELPVLDFDGATTAFEFDQDNEVSNNVGLYELDASGKATPTNRTIPEASLAPVLASGGARKECTPLGDP